MASYNCIRCDKKFLAKRTAKFCSDRCSKLYLAKKKKDEDTRKKMELRMLEKNRGGRIAHHKPLELADELKTYFMQDDKDQITPAGLLLFLGIDRKVWHAYETKPSLSRMCGWAHLMLEHYGTLRLYNKGRNADIFYLKNMGWTDRKEVATKETIVIGENINDEQAKSIIERYARRRRLTQNPNGKSTGDGASSKASKK